MNFTEQAVDFLGHQINFVPDADGTPYVPLKWLCEILGIDDKRQRREVKDSGVYNWKMLSVKGADGRHRKMLCLPVKQACLWFYIVNPNTVRPEIKDRLLEYQEESTTALRHHRQYGLANFEEDTPSKDKLLEKLEEVRSLEKDYRDLYSAKDDLFGLCSRLRDREPELCDQLWQFCCRVHERCEAIYSQIMALKEDLGCRYYWQVSCEDLYNMLQP